MLKHKQILSQKNESLCAHTIINPPSSHKAGGFCYSSSSKKPIIAPRDCQLNKFLYLVTRLYCQHK